jgi:hypothetical protein
MVAEAIRTNRAREIRLQTTRVVEVEEEEEVSCACGSSGAPASGGGPGGQGDGAHAVGERGGRGGNVASPLRDARDLHFRRA